MLFKLRWRRFKNVKYLFTTVDIIKPKIDASERTQRRIVNLNSQIQILQRKVQELTSKVEIKTRKAILYKELYSKSLSKKIYCIIILQRWTLNS